MKIKEVLCEKNISVGYIYSYVHLITEILCFYSISYIIGNKAILWMMPLVYDALAFVPQGIIGYISDKYPKIKIGIIGLILLILGTIIFTLYRGYFGLIILCMGNAFLHVDAAEVTLRVSEGKLSHSAIFVAGGSFGVIIGKILGDMNINLWWIVLLGITMLPFIMLGNLARKDYEKPCKKFNYHNEKLNPLLIIILATLIVVVRGYMGYGIPTSWNKTLVQTILLYVIMGFGKALGGIFCDLIGMRKTAVISMIASVPFLIVGDKIMIVSLFGVMLFSMTMAITLGLLTSVLKNAPGLAFGLTTIGLFFGTLPIFFIRIKTGLINSIMITCLSIICFMLAMIIIRKDKKHE